MAAGYQGEHVGWSILLKQCFVTLCPTDFILFPVVPLDDNLRRTEYTASAPGPERGDPP